MRAVRRLGALDGLAVLRRRLYLCGVAHRRYSALRKRPLREQRGDCDFDCDFGDCFDCASCDWSGRGREDKNKQKEKDRYVHIPPQRRAVAHDQLT
jgi:hypothetical protein